MSEAEIIARRRKWTAEEKAALLAEVEAEGDRVSSSYLFFKSMKAEWPEAMGVRE